MPRKKKAKPKRKRQKVVSYTVQIDDDFDVTFYTVARAHAPIAPERTSITRESIIAAINKLKDDFSHYALLPDMRDELKANSGRKRKELDALLEELVNNDELITYKEQGRRGGQPTARYGIPGEV